MLKQSKTPYNTGGSDAAVTDRGDLNYCKENLHSRIKTRHNWHRRRTGDRKISNGKRSLSHWHPRQSQQTLNLKLTITVTRRWAISFQFLTSRALHCWWNEGLGSNVDIQVHPAENPALPKASYKYEVSQNVTVQVSPAASSSIILVSTFPGHSFSLFTNPLSTLCLSH